MGVRVTTTAYDTKRALFAKIAEYAVAGQPLDGVQVSYAWPGNDVGLECIYGGGIRFDHNDAVAEHPGVLVSETTTISLYVRVVHRPPGPAEDADARAAEIGAWIATILRANPNLSGGGSWIGITGGYGDYSQTPDETVSVLSYQMRTARSISYGGG